MKTEVKSIRFSEDILTRIKELAELNHMNTSQFLRELIEIGLIKVEECDGNIRRCYYGEPT